MDSPVESPGVKRRMEGDLDLGPDSKRPRMLRLTAASHYLPKEDPEKPLGQDANFICTYTIGVADGVGGWAKKGIDSGVYARELMDNAYDFVEYESYNKVAHPGEALDYAFKHSSASGASTACIITLAWSTLYAVNVGDSGFLVIRDGEVVYRSPPQQIKFNCPYQLAVSTRCTPRHADKIAFEVEPSDILVAATDGLFDNLFNAQIEEIVNSALRDGQPPKVIATNLAQEARNMSLCREGFTPWTMSAVDHGRDQSCYIGGKYDDVTVIVGRFY